ncbi:MAG: hypothetical protein WAU47_13265 [Desulfobaccales bacterium]
MKRENPRRVVWFVALTLAILMELMGFNPAWSHEIFTTQYTVVRANSTADLLEMERRLHFAASAPAGPLPTRGEFAFHPGYSRLAAKIDGILLRVAGLLGIPPSRSCRVNLVLLPSGREVRQQHVNLVPGQRPGLFGYGSLEAFYYTGNRTVYLSLADLREGILAHEMTHHLLCTAVAPSPPAELQEKYAHYVESRL